MSDRDIGSPRERLAPAQRVSFEVFSRAAAGAGDGTLRLPAPFDLATSAALAQNRPGVNFHHVRAKVRTRFRLQLHEIVPGVDTAVREIIDHEGELAALLTIVMCLVEEIADQERETPDGT